MGVIGMLLVFLLVGVMVYSGLKTYKRARNKEARILTLAATLALISYFVHGILNNFLDTDKLSLPVWGSMAIIVVMDIYFADRADISIAESTEDKPDKES